MIDEEDINFIKVFLIVMKGGILLCRKVVQVLVTKSGRSLETLLQQNRKTFNDASIHGHLAKIQFEKLFPRNNLTVDIDQWDIALLTSVLLHVFSGSFNSSEIAAIKAIRETRNNVIGHGAGSKLTNKEFACTWPHVTMALRQLSRMLTPDNQMEYIAIETRIMVHPFQKDIIEQLEDIELTDTITQAVVNSIMPKVLEQIKMESEAIDRRRNEEIYQRLGQIEARQAEQGQMQQTQGQHIGNEEIFQRLERIEARQAEQGQMQQTHGQHIALLARMQVNTGSTRSRRQVQDHIIEASNSIILSGPDIDSSEDEVVSAVGDLFRGMEEEGVRVVKADVGSVLLTLECPTIKSMQGIVLYLKSPQIQPKLTYIEKAVNKCHDCVAKIAIDVDVESLESAINILETEVDNGAVYLTLECRSTEGVRNAFHIFENDESTNTLNKLSEALSSKVGEKVELQTRIDIDKLEDDIEKTLEEENKRQVQDIQRLLDESKRREAEIESLKEENKKQDENREMLRKGCQRRIEEIERIIEVNNLQEMEKLKLEDVYKRQHQEMQTLEKNTFKQKQERRRLLEESKRQEDDVKILQEQNTCQERKIQILREDIKSLQQDIWKIKQVNEELQAKGKRRFNRINNWQVLEKEALGVKYEKHEQERRILLENSERQNQTLRRKEREWIVSEEEKKQQETETRKREKDRRSVPKPVLQKYDWTTRNEEQFHERFTFYEILYEDQQNRSQTKRCVVYDLQIEEQNKEEEKNEPGMKPNLSELEERITQEDIKLRSPEQTGRFTDVSDKRTKKIETVKIQNLSQEMPSHEHIRQISNELLKIEEYAVTRLKEKDAMQDHHRQRMQEESKRRQDDLSILINEDKRSEQNKQMLREEEYQRREQELNRQKNENELREYERQRLEKVYKKREQESQTLEENLERKEKESLATQQETERQMQDIPIFVEGKNQNDLENRLFEESEEEISITKQLEDRQNQTVEMQRQGVKLRVGHREDMRRIDEDTKGLEQEKQVSDKDKELKKQIRETLEEDNRRQFQDIQQLLKEIKRQEVEIKSLKDESNRTDENRQILREGFQRRIELIGRIKVLDSMQEVEKQKIEDVCKRQNRAMQALEKSHFKQNQERRRLLEESKRREDDIKILQEQNICQESNIQTLREEKRSLQQDIWKIKQVNEEVQAKEKQSFNRTSNWQELERQTVKVKYEKHEQERRILQEKDGRQNQALRRKEQEGTLFDKEKKQEETQTRKGNKDRSVSKPVLQEHDWTSRDEKQFLEILEEKLQNRSQTAGDPVSSWTKDRKETIKELRRLGVNISIPASALRGVTVVAGIGAAACFLAAPFTAGASLRPAVALTGLVLADAARSIETSLTNHFTIEKCYTGSVQEALDKDRKSFEKLKKAIENAKQITVEEGIIGTFKAGKALPGGIQLKIRDRLDVSENGAANLLKLGQTARFASHAVAVVALPLDIVFFVQNVIYLEKGNVSAAADRVFELADQLQKEYDEIIADTA